jgi:hypothetical protein
MAKNGSFGNVWQSYVLAFTNYFSKPYICSHITQLMKIKYSVTAVLMATTISLIAQNPAPTPAPFKPVSIPDTSSYNVDHKMKDAFIGLGFVMGPSDFRAKVRYGTSREFIIGAGFGYKFVKWNGIGIDIYYKSTGYFLTQDSNKILPNTIQHNSEKISLDNFGGLVFDRFTFGKLFFDGGFYYDWAFYTKHIAWDNYTVANGSGGSSTKAIDRQLVFLNPSNYGLMFRLGNPNGASFYFNYRMSNVFKSGSIYPELPPYVIGITIGLHS